MRYWLIFEEEEIMNVNKILKDAIIYEYEYNFSSWLKFGAKGIKEYFTELKSANELREMLFKPNNWEAEIGSNFVAIKIEKEVKTRIANIKSLADNIELRIEDFPSTIPDYRIKVVAPKLTEVTCSHVVLVLVKYVDGFRLHDIMDINTWEQSKERPVKSMEYVKGKGISKEKVMSLGINYIEVKAV